MSSQAIADLPDLRHVSIRRQVEAWLTTQAMTLEELTAPNQKRDMVEARRVVARYLREHGWSYPQIGDYLGRDHTTVMHLLGALPSKSEERKS